MNIKRITPKQLAALNEAVEMLGGITEMGRALTFLADERGHPFEHTVGASQINNWRIRQVPPLMCPLIEKLTGGAIRCEDLNDQMAWEFVRKH